MVARRARVLVLGRSVFERLLIREALEVDDSIEIVGTAPTARPRALALGAPDALLLSIEDRNDLELFADLRAASPTCPVVLCSSFADPAEAHAIGASACCPMPSPTRSFDVFGAELRGLVRRVVERKTRRPRRRSRDAKGPSEQLSGAPTVPPPSSLVQTEPPAAPADRLERVTHP